MLTSYVNLCDALNLTGRLVEARKVVDEAMAIAGDIGRDSRWLRIASAEMAILAGDCGGLADAILPEEGRRAMRGTVRSTRACAAFDLALGRGMHDEERRRLDDLGPLADTVARAAVIGPAAVQRAELARRAGDLDAARRAIDDGPGT